MNASILRPWLMACAMLLASALMTTTIDVAHAQDQPAAEATTTERAEGAAETATEGVVEEVEAVAGEVC